MSWITAAYYSNAIVGTPQVGADVDITAVHTAPKFALGTGFTRADGARFRYGCSSGGVAKGKLCAPTFATAGLAISSNNVIAPASAVAVPGDTITAGSIGSRFVEITLATVTANQFAGGYFIVSSGTGLGQTFRIKGNTATNNPATGNVRFEFKEKIVVALAADTDVTIVPCLWNDVAVAGATNASPCGVSMGTTTTTSMYGWFCTRGIVATLQDGAWATGAVIVKSTAGGAIKWTTLLAGTCPVIGVGISDSGDATYGAAYIQID